MIRVRLRRRGPGPEEGQSKSPGRFRNTVSVHGVL